MLLAAMVDEAFERRAFSTFKERDNKQEKGGQHKRKGQTATI
jgi:hypothetical protein